MVRVAVLIKQVPRFESLALGPGGRLVRDGLALEMNPYCRRAVTKGVEVAARTGGTCTAVTLGPPAAGDVLREAVAWGADRAVLVTDPAFAGSDTLATARALAAALEHEGPFDLILAGRNSVDADTGQVGPEVAQLLGVPFAGGVRAVELIGSTVAAHLELDDGWADVEIDLPVLLSCAERLCEPAKVDPAGRARVPADRLRVLRAADLGSGPWGEAGSPTRVGEIRELEARRDRLVLMGTPAEQASRAVAILADAGALGVDAVAEPVIGPVPDEWVRGGKCVAVLVEPGRERVARELLGGAARLASGIEGRVVAVVVGPSPVDAAQAGRWGADEVVRVTGVTTPEDLGQVIGEEWRTGPPWAVLAPGTMWGRELASRLAVRLSAGLTGDAVDLAVDGGRLVGWKPAFGGRLVAAVTATSAVQMVTVRAGMLPLLTPRPGRAVPISRLAGTSRGRVRLLGTGRDDDLELLVTAAAVVGVGAGVSPDSYGELASLLAVLDADLGATRKVTDRGWLPRSRQIGLTGRSISPRLYVAVGLSGTFNHLVGVRGAGKIVAINTDPSAPVFEGADVGMVADWREAVPLLVAGIAARRSAAAPEGVDDVVR